MMLFFVVLFNFGAVCYGADIFVDDNCSSPGSGTIGDPFCLIQDGLTLAVDGDTVYVRAGTYAGGVIMKTGVDLLNYFDEQPIIETDNNFDNIVLFDGVNNCSLDGFVLDDSNRFQIGHALVGVFGTTTDPGDNLAIRNCVILGKQPGPGPILARAGIKLNGQLSIEITGTSPGRRIITFFLLELTCLQPQINSSGQCFIQPLSGQVVDNGLEVLMHIMASRMFTIQQMITLFTL